ncbi:MAG TPA: A24 family peptidase [Anaerolineales bacterium]|nr:A24 family peptidase [Anaerolineales bacterium]
MTVASFLLGFALGVVVNLLADSLPRHRRPRWPRCPACTAPRPALHLSGILALSLAGGRCPHCGARRGARAPLVEAVAAIGAATLSAAASSGWSYWTGMLAGFIFLLITVIDVEHKLILHIVSLPSAVALGLLRSLDPSQGLVKTLSGGLAGVGLLGAMYLLGLVFSRLAAMRRGMAIEEVAFGFGDVMLGGVLGLAVGWPGILVAVVLGIFAAGVFSLALILVQLVRRRYAAFLAIPYGPFLVLGAAVVLYGGREAFRALVSG